MFAKLTQVQKEELKLNEHATFHFPNAKDTEMTPVLSTSNPTTL